ncbi:MAG: C-terminal binding protein [Pusillimonas sp.]
MKRVVVTDYTFPDLNSERAAAEAIQASFEAFQCKTEEEVMKVARGADVLVVQFAPITQRIIDLLAPGAVLIRYGVGYDNIDVRYAIKAGKRVCYVPDYCLNEVADHAVSLLLAQLRRLKDLDASVRRHEWLGVKVAGAMKAFEETQVGFIGLGRIGMAAFMRLKPFEFQLRAYDPRLSDAQAKALGAVPASLDDILETSDAIMLHVPLTAETRHIINAHTISRMKPGAVIINCSRGDLIDEAALAEALDAGRVRAGLDVLSVEPPATGNRLLSAANSVLTPHIAWYSESAISNLQNLAADEISRALLGQAPRCPVPESAVA